VIDVHGRQALYLLLGDVELDTVLADPHHGADRHSHFLAAKHVPLPEGHVGHLVVSGVDDEAADLPDVAVGGMDVVL
jgi:hypothetical protein